jgi:hypothetical protein
MNFVLVGRLYEFVEAEFSRKRRERRSRRVVDFETSDDFDACGTFQEGKSFVKVPH